MKTLEFVKQEIKGRCEDLANQYGISIHELNFGELENIAFYDNKLDFQFTGYVVYSDSIDEKENISALFTCAYKTPKGYISSKKIPVQIKDTSNLTIEEASELLMFNTDAVRNTFDPFYHENEAKRRNAISWNSIAQNLSDEDTF